MSKIFYDHLLDLNQVEKKIKKLVKTPEEKEEFYRLVDEIAHHKVLGCILDRLPQEHHHEFLNQVSERPHDVALLDYLRDKITEDVEEFIKKEVNLLAIELLAILEEKTQPQQAKS